MATTNSSISSLTHSISSALVISDESNSPSELRRRLDTGPLSAKVAGPSQNAHLGRVGSVIWAEAFSYLSLRELCSGVVQACKYTRKCSTEALMLIFKCSAYGTHGMGGHHFWQFPGMFAKLRGETLSIDQLIMKYWKNKKSLDFRLISYF